MTHTPSNPPAQASSDQTVMIIALLSAIHAELLRLNETLDHVWPPKNRK